MLRYGDVGIAPFPIGWIAAVLRAEVSDPDMYAAIDKANDKLVSQIERPVFKVIKALINWSLKLRDLFLQL